VVAIEPVKPPDEIAACLDALQAGGIHGRKASEIATDPKVTVEDIQAHLAAAQGETWHNPLGMVIYRLQEHIRPPEIDPETGHAVSCKCNDCDTRRQVRQLRESYSGGHFAEYLNRGGDGEEGED
jgi:hypothetical protein